MVLSAGLVAEAAAELEAAGCGALAGRLVREAGERGRTGRGRYAVRTGTFVRMFHVLAKRGNLGLAGRLYRHGGGHAERAADMCLPPYRAFMLRVRDAESRSGAAPHTTAGYTPASLRESP